MNFSILLLTKIFNIMVTITINNPANLNENKLRLWIITRLQDAVYVHFAQHAA